jgi:transposase
VPRRSGKTCVIVRRYAGNKRLATALHHWARASQLSTTRSAAAVMPRYAGAAMAAALRTVADRLLSLACTLLEQQTLFDPTYKVPEAAGA